MFDTDVFVLGGGPAGLATAIALRRANLRVIVADAARPPVDKACGEGLMPDSLAAARRVGIAIPANAGQLFRGIRFQQGQYAAQADFPEGTALGVRRTVLHELLVSAAAEAGVEFLWRTPVTGIAGHTVRLRTEELNARWVVGADGAQSSVRRWANLDHYRRNSQRFSYRRHYAVSPWSEYMEIHWGERCQFYVTPVSSGEVCVVLMTRDPHQRVADALPAFPFLHRMLGGARIASGERGAPAITRTLRRVTRGHIALVGDASGNVDPITGEGICLAFQQAEALQDAIVSENLEMYESVHKQLWRRPRFMADFMLLMDRSRLLQRRTMKAFDRKPVLFQNLLAMHVGKSGVLQFARTTAALGAQIAGL